MNQKIKKISLFLVICVMAVIPLVVHMHNYSTNLAQFNWFPSAAQTDLFLYWKSVAIIVVAVLMCLTWIYCLVQNQSQIQPVKVFIPLFLYGILTLISSVLSKYRYFSFHGSMETFESVWVLLGYVIIAFYTYQIITTIDEISFILNGFIVGIIVMLTIGISQAIGVDLLITKLGKYLILNPAYWGNLDAISLTFDKGRVYMTLYNPNYVTSYLALVVPLLVAMLVFTKKKGMKIFYGVIIVACVVCLLASGNRSGIVGAAFAIVLAIILLYKQILKNWKIILPFVIIIGVIGIAFFSKNTFILAKFNNLFGQNYYREYPISQIVTGDDDVSIYYNNNIIRLSYEENNETGIAVTVRDDSGQEISYDTAENNTINITDERFSGFTITPITLKNRMSMDVYADSIHWYFAKGSDGTYYYYNVYGNWDKINNAERFASEFLENKFESRGIIWSKTIPLLKNNILLGSGADTYTVVYPQNDYVYKVYTGTEHNLDVKPHNLYLQMAVQSGVLAVLAFIVFYLWYFVQSIRILFNKKNKENKLRIIGIGIFFGTFIYMVIGILNDSTVGVAPIYWAMMGMGLAINRMIHQTNSGDKNEA